MNDELILILDSIRDWSKIRDRCRGNQLNIEGSSKCNWKCEYCPIIQIRSPKVYSDQIIITFSQLNK